jgi:uncharacterized membrane protein YebE (DUF533 family)
MFNSRDLLGSLLQAGVGGGGRPTSRRVEHAIGRDGSGGSLGRILQDMASGRGGGLGGLLGGGASGGGRVGGTTPGGTGGLGGGGEFGGLGDLLRGAGAGGGLGGLGAMLGGAGSGGAGAGGREFGRNPAAMGGLGALAGAILGGRKGNTMRGAVGGAGLAVLGAMALDALARREQGSAGGGTAAAPSVRPPDPEAAVPSDEAGQERLANLLMRAMLSAAKADGHIDGKEMERILGQLDEMGTDPAAKDFVLTEMRRPPDIQGLAAEARTPEVAAEVYAASLLAIEVDTQAERDYLKRLADALGLDAATVGRLHESLGAASGSPNN